MNKPWLWMMLSVMLAPVALAAGGGAVDGLLAGYTAQGATSFSAERGKTLWSATHPASDGGPARSCTSCHPADATQAGKHVRTGEVIEPLSPAVNPERLSDPANVEKWFKRNCTWTLGRECTAQEKGDVLEFLRKQGV